MFFIFDKLDFISMHYCIKKLGYYRVINVALKHAVDWQLLAYNPNERVKAPKKLKVEFKFYDLEQTKALLKALDGEHIKYQAIIQAVEGLN